MQTSVKDISILCPALSPLQSLSANNLRLFSCLYHTSMTHTHTHTHTHTRTGSSLLAALRHRCEDRWPGRAAGTLTRVGAQVHSELAGVAAGVGAELALEGTLVRVDPQVLVEAAAVRGRIVARLALVGLCARVAPHVGLQLVLAAEALATDFTLMRFVSFTCTRWQRETR
jgi:hypothetical protein